MKYKEIDPCSNLKPYIHCFWELKGDDTDNQWERIFPDGCAGLILNLGDTCMTDNGSVSMDYTRTYVAGTMTSFKDSFIDINTHLFGVCLKPAALSCFYNYAPQYELTDKTVQLEKSYSFEFDFFIKNPVHYLNNFFIDRLMTENDRLRSVINDIHLTNGQLGISEILKRNCTTRKKLERYFKKHIGVAPKEYSNIVRFQNALAQIKNTSHKKSLLKIAFECGYYDHSHLTNEIKRKTGLSPSQL